jgi:hypothetical protein
MFDPRASIMENTRRDITEKYLLRKSPFKSSGNNRKSKAGVEGLVNSRQRVSSRQVMETVSMNR